MPRFGEAGASDRFERRGPLPFADVWFEAIRDGSVPGIQNAVWMGWLDPNERDHNSRSMMTYAAEYGPPTSIVAVAEVGGEINPDNPDDGTPLLYAVYNDHPLAVPQLLMMGAEPDTPVNGLTPLMLAAMTGNLNAVVNLHNFGADIDRPHPATGQTPLMLALEADEPQIVAYLVMNGADLGARDHEDRDIFHYAQGDSLDVLLNLIGAIGIETEVDPD